jgi:hypothetical protein
VLHLGAEIVRSSCVASPLWRLLWFFTLDREQEIEDARDELSNIVYGYMGTVVQPAVAPLDPDFEYGLVEPIGMRYVGQPKLLVLGAVELITMQRLQATGIR